ncbi:MAG: response regulator [Polyangia bacterium]
MPATLLVVDDEPEIVKLVTKIFQARGFTVLSCSDGQQALDTIPGAMPDIVLLDIDLPKVDGWDVCKQLKSDERTRNIPIVMMTAAHVTTDEAEKGLGLGADEYIQKPFLREVLVHNIERLLASRA